MQPSNVQPKSMCWVQLADRKPFTGGPLDPRLVCAYHSEQLAPVRNNATTAASAESKTSLVGHKQQISTVPNLWPEAGGLHWTFWYVNVWEAAQSAVSCWHAEDTLMLLCRLHQTGAASVSHWLPEGGACNPAVHLQDLLPCPA